MRGSKKHETRSRVVALLLELVAAEVGLDVESSDSTTFRRENLERGFEPDERFYFGDTAGSVRGMDDVDLDAGDPLPDLVLEADLTSSSLEELPIFARLGVAEVWRYAGGRPEILGPIGEGYERMSPQTWLFRRSPAAFWMPAGHVLCVSLQVRPWAEVVVVELQL